MNSQSLAEYYNFLFLDIGGLIEVGLDLDVLFEFRNTRRGKIVIAGGVIQAGDSRFILGA